MMRDYVIRQAMSEWRMAEPSRIADETSRRCAMYALCDAGAQRQGRRGRQGPDPAQQMPDARCPGVAESAKEKGNFGIKRA
jgi:hypothetical protein